MRFGLFIVLLAVVIAMGAALIPSSVALPAVTGVPVSPLTTPECWTIAYAPGFDTSYLPRTLRLDADTIADRDNIQPLHRASGDAALGWRESGWWRDGPDSVDVSAHHSAIFRIPRGATPRIGRVQPYWNGSVLMGWADAELPKHPPSPCATFLAPIPCDAG